MNKFINKLQIDLLKRHLSPFLFCFFTLLFLLLMQFLILHIDKLIGKDIPLLIIIELIITNLAYMVVLAAPMAVLVATLMAFGKFSELNELTALRASGINPMKIIRPVLIASVLLFIGLAWFSNNVLPEANQKARSLFIDIRLKKPGFDLKPNTFYDGIEGYTFLVERIDSETDSLYDITLFQKPENNRDRAYIVADKGLLVSKGKQALTLHLIHGTSLKFLATDRRNETMIERNRFDKHIMTLDLSDLSFMRSDPEDRNRSDRTMSSRAMIAVVDSLFTEIEEQRANMSENTMVYPEDKYTGRTSYFNPNKVLPDTLDYITSIESPYLATNIFPKAEIQRTFVEESIRQMKEYRNKVESINANVEWRKKRIARYLVEIHKKLSIPFACVVFILFGAPVGIMTKRGNFGFAALISTVVLTFYWVSLIQGEKLADRLFITPLVGMWTFNVVLSLVGAYLIIHLTTDIRITKLFRNRD
ncbi:LptF/LptG family permease [Gracilimonas sediminicola]|uniref:LptF/LptG family permease n=1 Tax=Gracilimonas sediminicola TaxID=2952158 RepID=A0A9X2RGQ7_9BACT|nr:LptF/LptG family permease [Gracilimonas sediminicola]MCP9292512.1 LptF/LptG family permease [Gracilimonas sediminicola]